ncbi:MAG: acyl-ACP--UDP-N-acetylglucosamine O-acyltransferase, partial [Candidatus Omnitrophica bacterium]|nr:acyl-ACP--UDP-N-acetylglucosamine O-acyltransferase [Candidatus Omnitrophota bacterium]
HMSIHKSAVVSGGAEVHSSADIGAGVTIEENVIIGPDVKIYPNAFIGKGTTIGEGSTVHMGAVIGHEPQDFAYRGQKTFTRIGKNNVIREYVTIHRGTKEGSATVVGDDNFIMVQCHLGHNCVIGNNVIMANGALLAGHVEVGSGTFISGGVVFHQFCRLGEYVMVGGFSGVNKDVPPYMLLRGPSAIRGINLVGLRRAGFSRDAIREIKEAYKIFFLSGLSREEALVRIREKLSSEEAEKFASFIQSSKRGICLYRYNREEYFE